VEEAQPLLIARQGRFFAGGRAVTNASGGTFHGDLFDRDGGDAELLSLPSVGVRGNTDFPFADLDKLAVADLLSGHLRSRRLDLRGGESE
jgi:hypothetical protein